LERFRKGWQLTKKSWGLLRENRDLIKFPLYGAVATILVALVTLGPGVYLLAESIPGAGIPLVVLGIYLASFVGVYFAVALAAAANLIFSGQPATVADGLAVSRSRVGAIAGFAAISTLVSVIASALEEQGGIFGAIFGRLLSVGWSLISFLTVPVMAIEGTGAVDSIKRSAGIFRERWGQQITGNVAIGGLVFLLGIIPSGILIALGFAVWPSASFVGALLFVVGVLGIAIALLISKALTGIFGVALYRFATEGQAVGGFTPEELESAVRQKKGDPAPGTV